MFDPNVLNYFLVLLGGFGVVWSYRHTAKEHDKKISEFEYAAFSTLWGILVFFIFSQTLKSRPDLLNGIFALPMSGTPLLFGLGLAMGYAGAKLVEATALVRKYLESRRKE